MEVVFNFTTEFPSKMDQKVEIAFNLKKEIYLKILVIKYFGEIRR